MTFDEDHEEQRLACLPEQEEPDVEAKVEEVYRPDPNIVKTFMPKILRESKHWVLRKEKRPVNASGTSSGWSDPSFWTSYDEVSQALADNPTKFDGIGYIVSRDMDRGDSQIIGGDIDCCRDPVSGWVAPWADSTLKSLNAVVGISISGCGFRFFCLGKLPDGLSRIAGFGPDLDSNDPIQLTAIKNIAHAKPDIKDKIVDGQPAFNGIEIYEDGPRHLTVTGLWLSEYPTELENRTLQLKEIVKPFLEQKKLIKDKIVNNEGSKLPCIDILKVINTSGFEQSGQELVGPHPIFGSTTGTNLNVNPSSNVWYYWHAGDECGGDPWLWLAAECGAIEWSDCRPGALKDPAVISKTKQHAVDRRLFTEDELFPEKKAAREAYERSMKLMEECNFDPGTVFESKNVNLLAFLKSKPDGAGKYQTILGLLKQKHIRITDLNKLVDRAVGALNKSKGSTSPDEYISPAKQVVDAIKEANHELWHSPDRVSYITINDAHWMTRAPEFKAHITTSYNEDTGEVLSTGAINSIIETLSGYALRNGSPEHTIYTRIAMIDDKIYVDMANDSSEVIEISKDGWRIRDGAPVRFRRPAGMLPLPYPEKGGNLEELRPYINVADDQWILIKAWILGTINPVGSYAALVLNGPTGRLKTRTAERLKKILDPSHNKIEDKPKDEEALIIACYDNHTIAFDNVSYLSEELSNKFCMISTGVAFRQRTLYTNMESVLTVLRRPDTQWHRGIRGQRRFDR